MSASLLSLVAVTDGAPAESTLSTTRSNTENRRSAGWLPAVPFCAPVGIRTPNLLIRSQMLYPLSYRRMSRCEQHDRMRIADPDCQPEISPGPHPW